MSERMLSIFPAIAAVLIVFTGIAFMWHTSAQAENVPIQVVSSYLPSPKVNAKPNHIDQTLSMNKNVVNLPTITVHGPEVK